MHLISSEKTFKTFLMCWAQDPNFATFHLAFYKGGYTSGELMNCGYRHINFEQSVEDSFEIELEARKHFYESIAVYSGDFKEAMYKDDAPMHADFWRATRGCGLKALFHNEYSGNQICVSITPLYV